VLELLQLGFQLTLFGMGLVFLLLALLWGGMALLVRLDRPPAPIETATPSEPVAAMAESKPDPDLLAAITIAVFMHRQVRRKQAAPLMRSHLPGALPSRWVMAGRTRQNQNWQPNRK
jgi:sodium pump decarboxylase gamma subunit